MLDAAGGSLHTQVEQPSAADRDRKWHVNSADCLYNTQTPASAHITTNSPDIFVKRLLHVWHSFFNWRYLFSFGFYYFVCLWCLSGVINQTTRSWWIQRGIPPAVFTYRLLLHFFRHYTKKPDGESLTRTPPFTHEPPPQKTQRNCGGGAGLKAAIVR